MPLEQKTRKTNILGYYGNLKWYLQESNQGHKDFQSFALPTELRYLLRVCKYKILFHPSQRIYSKNL